MSTPPQPEGTGHPQPPVAVRVAQYGPPRRRSWAPIVVVLLLLALLGSLFLNLFLASVAGVNLAGALESDRHVQEKYFSHNSAARNKIAILPIEGIILESEEGFVKRAIDRAMKDDNLKALVLRVDSPGGSVSGSDYIYHHLRDLATQRNIPIVVSMGGIAASGGYYVSMAAGTTPDVIFAEPTGFTGSIGVIIPHYNFSGLMEKIGATEDSIASNPLKTMGSFTKPMSEKERKIFQELVDDSFGRFKDIVKSGRGKFQKDPAALDRLATGQIYTADQARRNGLVDKLGFIEDAVDRAIELAGVDKDDVKVVKYKPEASLSAILMGGEARHHASALDLAAILETITPRAYYLCTWLPGLESAKP